MAINKVVNVNEETDLYKEIKRNVDAKSEDDLIIVARAEINRKADEIRPVAVMNGIYFYVAYQLKIGLAFLSSYTPEQILKAVENTINRARFMTIPASINDFASIFNNPPKKLSEMENFSLMNPLTCEGNQNGAGILFCHEYLKAIREKIGDFYILPSSIHEVLIVPNDGTVDINDLNSIVQDVNANEVSENDYLADRAFTVDEWI